MTAVVPGGLNSGHLAETIEAALDAEDLNPLVMIISFGHMCLKNPRFAAPQHKVSLCNTD